MSYPYEAQEAVAGSDFHMHGMGRTGGINGGVKGDIREKNGDIT